MNVTCPRRRYVPVDAMNVACPRRLPVGADWAFRSLTEEALVQNVDPSGPILTHPLVVQVSDSLKLRRQQGHLSSNPVRASRTPRAAEDLESRGMPAGPGERSAGR